MKYSTCPPWYELTATPWTSSWTRGGHHLVDAAVVTEVDDLGALRLQQPAHDVDGGVVAVEQAAGRHEPDRVLGHVQVGGVALTVGSPVAAPAPPRGTGADRN